MEKGSGAVSKQYLLLEMNSTLFEVSHLASEGLDGAVDVRVLLQPRARREGLAALGAGVAPGAHVVGADVALQVRRVGEDLLAVLAGEAAELAVHRLVAEEVGPPRERLGAVVARVLVRLVAVALHHVLVQSALNKTCFEFVGHLK